MGFLLNHRRTNSSILHGSERTLWEEEKGSIVFVKEYVTCVSIPEYGLDCQSRRSKSCVVNNGTLSTEVLRVVIGYRSTRSKLFRLFGLEVKDGLNNGADGRVQGRGAQITVPTSPSSVITAEQSYASGFVSQQVMSPECRSHCWKRRKTRGVLTTTLKR